MVEQNTSSSSDSASKNEMVPKLDRREYFRVEDQLILRYSTASPEAVASIPAERHFDNSEMFSLLRELRQIDQEHNNVLRGITEQNRELGAYLKSTNRKIDLIANALATLSHGHQQQVAQRVSISEGGIAFASDPNLKPGKFIAIELVLLPSHTGLALYGEILETRDANGLTVVSFVRMRESDRQILAKHIMQVQIAIKRQQNKDDDTQE